MSAPLTFRPDLVLQPAWNETTAQVMPGYRDDTTTDPLYRFKIPAGNSLLLVSNESRFVLTPMMLRSGETITVSPVVKASSSAVLRVAAENPAEMWFTLSGTPTVFDRRTTRIGVAITPLSPTPFTP